MTKRSWGDGVASEKPDRGGQRDGQLKGAEGKIEGVKRRTQQWR